jgi:2-polyprenyl-3-methyl-5-hydroxy-6-metoxy-1,4-benzoquinol methylase
MATSFVAMSGASKPAWQLPLPCNMDFYDSLAQQYDQLTAAASRQATADAFVGRLLAQRPIERAVDVACGTGLFALAMARRGVRTTGIDISSGMLRQARQAADSQGLQVNWLAAPMQQLPAAAAGPFDAVLCMGNSLPHLLSADDLAVTLAGFAKVLAPGGLAAMHLLNYRRVLQRRERIVGIQAAGETTFVRFYDFGGGEMLTFSILELRRRGSDFDYTLHSANLRPWLAGDVASAARNAGMGQVTFFGGLDMGPFDADQSDTVLIMAAKSP